MLFNVKPILHQHGASLPFAFSLDLSQLDFFGYHPMLAPVRVQGAVSNRADVLWLEGLAEAELSLVCDRCGVAFVQMHEAAVRYMLADELQEERDDILLLEDGCIDLEQVFEAEFILSLPAKNLCEENCKGLCSGCGVNLNVEPCQCKGEIDPRLADLARFFEQ